MQIDVYDFDGTIYDGDCTVDFWLYCIRHRPWILYLLPFQGFCFLMLTLKIFSGTRAKGLFLRYLRHIPVNDEWMRRFYERKKHKLMPWFKPEKNALPTVIISASPQFIVEALCINFNVKTIIGTRCDIKKGAILGKNCKREEKIRRLHELYDTPVIRRMYTDSLKNDRPLLLLAKERYLVKNRQVVVISG
ncbi:MAG: haloacid dehalogenase-like hydrolase [Oscillospiraceae bacterium]|nr:haloacid dehalogenase-like hydrolase [Oscillospiraceae bacterium]